MPGLRAARRKQIRTTEKTLPPSQSSPVLAQAERAAPKLSGNPERSTFDADALEKLVSGATQGTDEAASSRVTSSNVQAASVSVPPATNNLSKGTGAKKGGPATATLDSVYEDVFGEEELRAHREAPKTRAARAKFFVDKPKKHHMKGSKDVALQFVLRAGDSRCVLQQVTVSQQGEKKAKVKKEWTLSDIVGFDLPRRSIHDSNKYPFVLRTNNKELHFRAGTLKDRNVILWNTWQIRRCLVGSPPETRLDMLSLVQSMKGQRVKKKASDDRVAEEAEDVDERRHFVGLSPGEERDLEELLNAHSAGSKTADIGTLVTELAAQVEDMQAATTEQLIAITSEESSRAVTADDISDAEFHLANVETWLGFYDSQLKDMKQYIRHLEEKNNEMAIISRNQHAVVAAVEDIFEKLQLDFEDQLLLEERDALAGDLSKYERAAKSLEDVFLHTMELPEHVVEMKALKEQQTLFQRIKDDFTGRIRASIEKEVDTVAGEYLLSVKAVKGMKKSKSSHADESLENAVAKMSFLCDRLRHLQNKHLCQFGNLMQFMYSMAPDIHGHLVSYYCKAMRPPVKKHLKLFITQLRKRTFRGNVLPLWRTHEDVRENNKAPSPDIFNSSKLPTARIPKKLAQADLSTVGEGSTRASLSVDLALPCSLKHGLIPFLEQEWEFWCSFFVILDGPGLQFGEFENARWGKTGTKEHGILLPQFQLLFSPISVVLSEMLEDCAKADPLLVVSSLVHCDRILYGRPQLSAEETGGKDGVLNSLVVSFVNSSVTAPGIASLEKNLTKWVESATKYVSHEFLLRAADEPLRGSPARKEVKKGLRGARKEVKQLKAQLTKSVGILPFVRQLGDFLASFFRAIMAVKDAKSLPSGTVSGVERHEFSAIVVGAEFSPQAQYMYRHFDSFALVSEKGREVCGKIVTSLATSVINLIRKFVTEEGTAHRENPTEFIRIALPAKHKKKVRMHLVIALENFYTLAALFDTFSLVFPGLDAAASLSRRYCTSARDVYLRFLMSKTFRPVCEFFDGISSLVASSGIPKSEISYQKQYSTQALNGLVAKHCTPAQVSRSAQKAAKQLRHDISRDAHSPGGKRELSLGSRTLLVELWHAFVVGLLKNQYALYEGLAGDCYSETFTSGETRVLPELEVDALLGLIAGTESNFDSDDDDDYEITMTNFSDEG